jgi:putative heme-binding domain-containing protein
LRLLILLSITAVTCYGQQANAAAARRAPNPLAGKPEAIAAGEKLYGTRCAGCHGKGGKGAEGPNLHRSRVVVISPPARLFEVIRNGIPGSEMPPFIGEDEKVWQVVSYIHSITRPGQGPPVPGDADAGRKVFKASGCIKCHIVEGAGGALGPDLSSIALQSSSEAIRESVLKPGEKITEGFHAIRITTKSGKQIQGVLKNQDNFSVQILTHDGSPMGLLMSEIASLQVERRQSLMPEDHAKKLSEADLQNLLAFLDRQRKPFIRTQVSFQNY